MESRRRSKCPCTVDAELEDAEQRLDTRYTVFRLPYYRYTGASLCRVEDHKLVSGKPDTAAKDAT